MYPERSICQETITRVNNLMFLIQVAMVKAGFDAQREFLVKASKCKPPAQVTNYYYHMFISTNYKQVVNVNWCMESVINCYILNCQYMCLLLQTELPGVLKAQADQISSVQVQFYILYLLYLINMRFICSKCIVIMLIPQKVYVYPFLF